MSIHVRFRVGDESFALPVGQVLEVAELGSLAPVPGAPPSVLGVRNLRGQVLPVIDLAGVLGTAHARGAQRLVIAEEAGRRAGLAIDEVTDVAELTGPMQDTALALPVRIDARRGRPRRDRRRRRRSSRPSSEARDERRRVSRHLPRRGDPASRPHGRDAAGGRVRPRGSRRGRLAFPRRAHDQGGRGDARARRDPCARARGGRDPGRVARIRRVPVGVDRPPAARGRLAAPARRGSRRGRRRPAR